MTTQIWLDHTGGPEVLQVRTVDRDAPGPGQVWLDQEAIGVNYLDVTQRMGAVPIPLPGGLGLEGAGTVAAVGAGVTEVAVGDRVAYALGPLGGYADGRLYPAERLIRLPDAVTAQGRGSDPLQGTDGAVSHHLDLSGHQTARWCCFTGSQALSVRSCRAGRRISVPRSSASCLVLKASTRPRRQAAPRYWCGDATTCPKGCVPQRGAQGGRGLRRHRSQDVRHLARLPAPTWTDGVLRRIVGHAGSGCDRDAQQEGITLPDAAWPWGAHLRISPNTGSAHALY